MTFTIWQINYYSRKIKKLIRNLSSDALFFYLEKPSIISGYGNKIKYLTTNQINKYQIINLKIIDSKISSITKDVYHEFDHNYQYYKTKKIINNLYFNMLQQPAFKINPKLKKFYIALKKEYQYVMLYGSGGAFIVW
ncbi:hypothetical protein [Spiroplasma endosymbiont of Polydrusus pterygomalis]|uniref:hypothetical protein n=1 Tax=Spiroplasma endosymbiont of Polydrusus pterygomalis TaxID=3139327 RepID=UPI003CCB04F1